MQTFYHNYHNMISYVDDIYSFLLLSFKGLFILVSFISNNNTEKRNGLYHFHLMLYLIRFYFIYNKNVVQGFMVMNVERRAPSIVNMTRCVVIQMGVVQMGVKPVTKGLPAKEVAYVFVFTLIFT